MPIRFNYVVLRPARALPDLLCWWGDVGGDERWQRESAKPSEQESIMSVSKVQVPVPTLGDGPLVGVSSLIGLDP